MIKVQVLSGFRRCGKTYYIMQFVEIRSVIGDGVCYFLAGIVCLKGEANLGV